MLTQKERVGNIYLFKASKFWKTPPGHGRGARRRSVIASSVICR